MCLLLTGGRRNTFIHFTTVSDDVLLCVRVLVLTTFVGIARRRRTNMDQINQAI